MLRALLLPRQRLRALPLQLGFAYRRRLWFLPLAVLSLLGPSQHGLLPSGFQEQALGLFEFTLGLLACAARLLSLPRRDLSLECGDLRLGADEHPRSDRVLGVRRPVPEGDLGMREEPAPETLVRFPGARLGGQTPPGYVGHIHPQVGDWRRSPGVGVLGLAPGEEVVETPVGPFEFQVGVPPRVVEHVREDMKQARGRTVRELEDGVVQRLDQMGVGDRWRARPPGQRIDAASQVVATGAEAAGGFPHGGGKLRGQVAAVSGLAALVLGGGYRQVGVVVGLAHPRQRLARRVGIGRQGEHQ